MQPRPPTVVPASRTSKPNGDRLDTLLSAVREALAATGSGSAWAERVRAALGALAAAFGTHSRVAQTPEGLHCRVLAAEPRLANAVATQVRAQGQLAEDMGHLLAYVGSSAAVESAEEVRGRGRALMARMARHHQAGSDLLHEADQADIGGEC